MIHMKTTKNKARLASVLIPTAVLLIFLLKEQIITLSGYLPECQFYYKTGYLCPGCGNTRSLISLLNGNIINSLGYNISLMVIILLSLCGYIEIVSCALGKKIHIIPRSYFFLTVLLTTMILYYLLRNFIPLTVMS